MTWRDEPVGDPNVVGLRAARRALHEARERKVRGESEATEADDEQF